MRLLALAALVLILAGCTSNEPLAPDALVNNTSAPVFAEDYALGENTTIPREALQNATLGDEHIHDLWGSATELVLLDGTVEAGLCEGPFDATFYLAATLFEHQEAAAGCARLSLPEGAVVPEGTGTLHIEVDATEALKSGSMVLDWRNKAREEVAEATADPVHTWSIPLTSADWDLPHAPATTFVIYVTSRGPAGLLEGPMEVRVVAEKIPDWQPVLAVAHVDHWRLPQLHDVPAPGAMRLFDGVLNVTNIDPQRFFGQNLPEDVPLTDIIAPGTSHLTLVVDRVSSSCAPVLDCWLVPGLLVGGYERERFGTLLLAEGERRVYAWTVPEEVPEDSVYANASTTHIDPRIDACIKGAEGATCGLAGIASSSVSARVLVLAWKDDIDLDLLHAIADTPTGGGG